MTTIKILRYRFTILISKLLIRILRLFGSGGTTLPGKAALFLAPGITKYLSKQFNIIMITGTNGKTTTVRIISQILNENSIPHITNKSGANLISGILTTFLENVNLDGKCSATTALFEIDEAAFRKITDFLHPDTLVVTNFFRDQLDRYGELYSTVKGIQEGIEKSKDTELILNADDSLCASLGKNAKNRVIYYGFDLEKTDEEQEPLNSDAAFCLYCKEKYIYKSRIYAHLGKYYCPKCGYSRSETMISLKNILKINSSFSEVEFATPAGNFNAKINLPGLFNIYNALSALAFAESRGFPQKNTIRALKTFECGFGRMEGINIDGKNIKVILVKNPTGFNQVIRFLITETENMQIAFLINDKYADGTDISWLWDVDFELLTDIQKNTKRFFTSGLRAEDMAVRLKYAGITSDKIEIIHNYKHLLDKALSFTENGETLYILPTYTAMLEIRKILQKRYKLKKFWA